MIRVKEIFYSIQGEGVYQGISTVFIRLAGCNLAQITPCQYCDTSYAWNPEDGVDMKIGDIVGEVSKLSPYYSSWVCITGGEPLWQEEELEQLVRELKKGGYKTTIETNGSFRVPRWYTLVDSWNADIKCPSSGVCGVSKEEWFRTRISDQVKFVVGNKEDLEFAGKLIQKHKIDSPIILISPITGFLIDKKKKTIEEYWRRDWLQECVEFCKENRCHFSLQWQKVIWGDQKGV